MARDTPSEVTGPFRAETSQGIYLIHIQTGADAPYENVYICSGDGDVEMGGNTWQARPLEMGDYLIESHEEVGQLAISIGDGDGLWKTLLDANADFRGERVTVYHTDRSALGSANPLTDAIRDDFEISNWERVHGAVAIQILPMMALLREVIPKGTVTRDAYPGIPPTNALI